MAQNMIQMEIFNTIYIHDLDKLLSYLLWSQDKLGKNTRNPDTKCNRDIQFPNFDEENIN